MSQVGCSALAHSRIGLSCEGMEARIGGMDPVKLKVRNDYTVTYLDGAWSYIWSKRLFYP